MSFWCSCSDSHVALRGEHLCNAMGVDARDGDPPVLLHFNPEDTPRLQGKYTGPKCWRTLKPGTLMAEEDASDSVGAPPNRRVSTLGAGSLENITRVRNRLQHLPKAMAALRRFQRMIAERARKRRADEVEVERGVQIERVFDFYDPMVGRARLRKINDQNIHQRARAKGRQPPNADGGEQAGDDAEGKRPMLSSGSSDTSSCSSPNSPRNTELAAEFEAPAAALGEPEKIAKRPEIESAETIAAWGFMVAKVLRKKVICLNSVTGRALTNRKIEQGCVQSFRIMQSVKSRAERILKQATTLAQQIGQETCDMFDNEWQAPDLLRDLFGVEYIDGLLIIANTACKVVAAQPPLVQAEAPCRIFGDTHGQLRDVLMLFHAFGAPSAALDTSFVFNGDFVDRGKHQLALVGLLFALKIAMPDKVWLVRGNHEDRMMNSKYGFEAECRKLLGNEFGPKVLQCCQKVFDQLPLACVVAKRVLCVHGGLGDATWRLGDLLNIRRPLTNEALSLAENKWIMGILWSDPIEDDDESGGKQVFGVHPSPRGVIATEFGWDVTKTFCARHGLSLIVRSHQSKHGSPGFDVMHENLLIRVFSARDYEGHGNDGAVLLVQPCTEGDAAEQGLLSVRPQVLRSATKARNEAALHAGATASDEPAASGPAAQRGRARSKVAPHAGATAADEPTAQRGASASSEQPPKRAGSRPSSPSSSPVGSPRGRGQQRARRNSIGGAASTPPGGAGSPSAAAASSVRSTGAVSATSRSDAGKSPSAKRMAARNSM